MKRIACETQFSPQQLQEVERLANALSLTQTTTSVLYARGFDSEEKMRRFLTPSARHFLSPELMRGMKEAKALLTQAKEEGWSVVVFGDYDADGIGASSILYRALKEFGIEPYLYVPERSEGYGMSIVAIDRIFDEVMPDLFVTVDCGISNAKEVQYIQEQGAYVIVTDHHELPEGLPDCICINPKLADDYPYDNLCGAGVAFKLACALLGEEAYALLDICALSTVADSVPLLGENRDIVAEGLKRINEAPRRAFSVLLGNVEEVTAQTLAFTVAPRVNAAGRMGDARSALRLFTTDDEEEILLLAEKLNLYNSERQKLCDELYEAARTEIKNHGVYQNVVMAMGEGWHAGLIGIVAARLAEEFSRPALLFVKNGEVLRGSARSIENVNIYEALKASSEYIEEFGGHSQAAGVNLKAENFERLQSALNDYLGRNYSEEDFIPTLYCSGEKSADCRTVARELNLLEPFGVGNRRPLFTLSANSLKANPVKALSPHLAVSDGNFDYMYFSGAKDLKLLKSDLPKTLVFEYNISKFRGREYLKGYIRSVVAGSPKEELLPYAQENALLSLQTAQKREATSLLEEQMNKLIAQKREERYGLCVIAYRRQTLSRFSAAQGLPIDVFFPSSGGAQNVALLAPDPTCDLSSYRDIVYLETPPALLNLTGRANVYFNGEERSFLQNEQFTREQMLSVYGKMKEHGAIEGESIAEAAIKSQNLGFSQMQFTFALAVFLELGLVENVNGYYTVMKGKKSDLQNSAIYRNSQEKEE